MPHNAQLVRGVAQPGSALAWGARGREFESRRPDQNSRKKETFANQLRLFFYWLFFLLLNARRRAGDAVQSILDRPRPPYVGAGAGAETAGLVQELRLIGICFFFLPTPFFKHAHSCQQR